MILRATTVTLGLAAAAVMLSGCVAPAPEPTPTSTAVFASEDEAFAAAEETYRAYNDAANARDADPTAQPDPQSFLVGTALEADIATNREFEEVGIHIEGTSSVVRVVPVSVDLASGDVAISVCIDSSNARVINEVGEDVTRADRDPTVATEVRLVPVAGSLRIESMRGVTDDAC
jgi:hypothetical protein